MKEENHHGYRLRWCSKSELWWVYNRDGRCLFGMWELEATKREIDRRFGTAIIGPKL